MRDVYRGSANYRLWSIEKIQLTYQFKNGYYSQFAFSEHVHIIAIIDKFLEIIIIANILLKWLICDVLPNLVPLYNLKKKTPMQDWYFSNPPWVFFTFFELYKWHQISLIVSYVPLKYLFAETVYFQVIRCSVTFLLCLYCIWGYWTFHANIFFLRVNQDPVASFYLWHLN